jgi:hypothetical protein
VPPETPEFFIDRSLGAKRLRRAFEQAGFVAYTMNRHYGIKLGERVLDPRWIREAGEKEWLILTKDDVRSPDSQIQLIEDAKAKVFFLTDRHLKSKAQIAWYMTNLDAILRAAKKDGPFMYGVYADRITKLQLRPPPAPPPAPEQTSILEADG